MTELQNRDLFFKYLEKNGLNPVTNSSILEVAPNVLQSESALLVQKYGELYKQFLLSHRFEQDNELGVKGMVGGALLASGKTLIIPDKLFVRKPKATSFDTLLIRGQLDEAYSLALSDIPHFYFGDVIESNDYRTLNAYLELYRIISKHFGSESCDFVKEAMPKYGKEACLIKK